MRALSLAQASRCETAKHKQCKCRCHGALHGVNRAPVESPDRLWFEDLPEDDPHHLPTKEEIKKRNRIRRSIARAPDQMRMWEEHV